MSRYPPHYAGSAPPAYPVIYKASPPVSPSLPSLQIMPSILHGPVPEVYPSAAPPFYSQPFGLYPSFQMPEYLRWSPHPYHGSDTFLSPYPDPAPEIHPQPTLPSKPAANCALPHSPTCHLKYTNVWCYISVVPLSLKNPVIFLFP